MPLNLASPGIVVKEFDLTLGRVAPSSNKTGAIVSPFARGPVDVPTLVQNENDLLNIFGEPYATDKHYENWLTASSFLAYGGSLRVVRANDSALVNGMIGTAASVKIDSSEHYNLLGYDENTLANVVVAARNPGSWSNGLRVAIIDSKADQTLSIASTSGAVVGYGISQSVVGRVNPGAGSTAVLDGYLKGIITGIGAGTLDVKVLSHVSAGGTETTVDYQESGIYSFYTNQLISVLDSSVGVATTGVVTARVDWFGQQTIGVTTNSSINWNSVAQKPGTSAYAAARGSRFDEVHVVVIDDKGKISGNSGTILEKHLNLSKAKDAEYSTGSPSYWRKYLEVNSNYLFAGSQPHSAIGGITTCSFNAASVGATTLALDTNTSWDQTAAGVAFGCHGSNTLKLLGGLNYNGQTGITTTGALTAPLGNLTNGYALFENTDNYKVDFLLMGSAAYAKETAQALANKLISVAELRKDCLAFVSPYRAAALTDTSSQTAVTVNSDADITDNVISFYSPIKIGRAHV